MNEYDIGSKLKELRLARSLTLQAVAREIGFSIALLSQIENNHISPPIATLSKLARFFNVQMASLFTEKDEEKKYEIIRKQDRKFVSHVVSRAGASHGYFFESLSSGMKNKKMVPFIITVSDEIQDSTTYSNEGESFIHVLRGSFVILLNGSRITLEEGDSIYFDTSLEHRFLPAKGTETTILEVTAGRS
jgi:transcriptional regulator with XRE-family HTH domain